MKSVDVPKGTTVLDAARQAGINSQAPCGGEGICGKCLVRIAEGEVDFDRSHAARGEEMADGVVLACKSKITNSPVIVDIPKECGTCDGQIAVNDLNIFCRDILPQEAHSEPIASKWKIKVPPSMIEDGLSDFDRLARAVRNKTGAAEVTSAMTVMRATADALRAKDGEVTVTGVSETGRIHIIGIDPGDTVERLFAIAVDIGTTTIALDLVDISSRHVLSTEADYNAQISCGSDIISRINYAKNSKNLEELRRHAVDTINRLVDSAAGACNVDTRDISGAYISGNTVMTHLFLGLKPEFIRIEPYTPTILDSVKNISSAQVGINIRPDAPVLMSPCAGSYVGGDITAGLLCAGNAFDAEDISLFIDIGTNGELVIGNSEFLMASACSAGPAFEGGGIDCGMRAAKGAIEKVEIDPDTGRAFFSTIGGAPPLGICGSAVVDLLACLFLTGLIDRSGKFDRSFKSPFIVTDGKKTRYVIATADESQTGRAITISEKEISNIIRAKAAIYSAAALLLGHAGMSFNDLSNVYIAGGFGRYLDLKQAIAIGLLPDIPLSKYKYLGNASLKGSSMMTISGSLRRKQQELWQRMTYFDLSTNPAYMHQFTSALFLPHTDIGQFPSVAGIRNIHNPVAESNRRRISPS